jgi:hypothetical protein
MAAEDGPLLSNEARDRAKAITDHFDASLKRIAKDIALANLCESVLRTHVTEAFVIFRRSGFSKKATKWYQRPDFKVAMGSILIGLAPAIGGFAKDIVGPQNGSPVCFWLFVITLPVLVGVGGFCLAAFGWLQAEHLAD